MRPLLTGHTHRVEIRYIQIPTIFGLPTFFWPRSTTDETLVVEMRIWCIKIGNVFALQFNRRQSHYENDCLAKSMK
jgi:hypothetical protein